MITSSTSRAMTFALVPPPFLQRPPALTPATTVIPPQGQRQQRRQRERETQQVDEIGCTRYVLVRRLEEEDGSEQHEPRPLCFGKDVNQFDQ
jgi:hypothetical protein